MYLKGINRFYQKNFVILWFYALVWKIKGRLAYLITYHQNAISERSKH